MIISRVEITNFRSFGEVPVGFSMEPVSALVGENNVGKSNVLLALDLFRNFKKAKVRTKDFHGNDDSKEIKIQVTYAGLTPDEKRLFRRHLGPNNTLTIIQSIKPGTTETEDSGETGGANEEEEAELDVTEEKTALRVSSGIDWLDEPPTNKKEIEKLWKGEMKVGDVDFKAWSKLPAAPTKEDFAAKIVEFWDEKWDAIPKKQEESDTKPLGWPTKLVGNLPLIVFVPAAKKISEEAKRTKTTPFGAMLDWFVGSIKAEFRQAAQSKLDEFYKSVMAQIPKEVDEETKQELTRLDLINRELTKHLPADFSSTLNVSFRAPEANQTLFGEAVLTADDGFLSEIGDKGHGMQRAALLAIIRSYLSLRPKLDKKGVAAKRIIFAVEEPEIYLHPTVIRSTYALFRELATAGEQVIYTTHDGYLLDVSRFNEIRVFRKSRSTKFPTSTVDAVSEDVLLKIWHALTGRKDITLESVREHLNNVYDPYRNEGFLSKAVMLCEGPTERTALPTYFDALGFNLDKNGVAAIDAGSVDLLDYFYILFTELGIPTFVIWDADKPTTDDISTLTGVAKQDAESKSKRNRYLATLLGLKPAERKDGACFWDSDQIADRCAVFHQRYEQSALTTLPDSESVRGAATKLFGSDSKPMTARFYALQAVKRGKAEGDAGKYVPATVKNIREKLAGLKPAAKLSEKFKGAPEKQ